ncbi:Rad4-domain-containing protein, partial [Patellaria atrata CBS 101060]
MPPFVPRKRRSASPSAPPPPAKCVATTFKRAKPSLFDTLDQTSRKKTKSAEDVQAFLNTLDDSDEGLSDAKSDEFEDVISYTHKCKSGRDGGEEDEDDEMEDWEDAIPSSAATLTTSLLHEPNPQISGDLQITFNARGGVDAESSTQTMMGKKGPSKKERQARFMTHCMHVQFLLFHNLVRNAWISDKEVQKILVDAVNDGVRTEVKRWKKACGTTKEQEGHDEQATQKLKGKGKQKKSEKGQKGHRNQRDWGNDAEMLEDGVPNLSHGDPTLRLLKYLASYWKKRFKVTAPGLRKQGYKPLRVLRDEVQAFRKDPTDPNRFGERVESLKEFRTCAKECKGSRDIGAQLFTSLLRALGLEARMVTSLQPAGFGFSKVEEAEKSKTVTANGDGKDNPITVDDDSSLLSSADSYIDNDSITEVTPHVSPTAKQSSKGYDRDMPFPIYWTEVLSPISNMYIPVDATVLSTVANTQELVASFEPRGKQADKSKQVIAYVVAYNNDGCAKDVTVRYLKRRTIPGKTKGFRFPVQKVPIYNRKGKVARYEQFDWFKTVIRCYARDPTSRTLADELEDQGDLVPAQPDKKPKEGGTETLQAYKNSAEYVLERHLRREEAILPGSKSVKTFTSGKGDKAKTEPVFRRKDVVTCKTVESWHKEGRAIIAGAQPVKFVPMRAVTLMRKREIEAAERESGEKMKQGLYHERQTEWIIPDPIVDGKIPRNAFGNIDVYVPTMVPRGSVHIPLRGTGKVCKKLGIDYAEACTGFEFGHRMAVPVLTGVVVAVEHEDAVIDAWEADQREQIRKENAKREKLVLGLWKKFYTGLRIVERVKKEY